MTTAAMKIANTENLTFKFPITSQFARVTLGGWDFRLPDKPCPKFSYLGGKKHVRLYHRTIYNVTSTKHVRSLSTSMIVRTEASQRPFLLLTGAHLRSRARIVTNCQIRLANYYVPASRDD